MDRAFAFHGYLPIEPGERAKKLKTLEQRVYAEKSDTAIHRNSLPES